MLLALQYGTLWLSGKLFNPLPDPGFVPLSTIVAIQFVPLLAICGHHRHLHLAADRLEPAGRPDLRTVRHLVRGGRHDGARQAAFVERAEKRSDGLKLHSALAFAEALAVL